MADITENKKEQQPSIPLQEHLKKPVIDTVVQNLVEVVYEQYKKHSKLDRYWMHHWIGVLLDEKTLRKNLLGEEGRENIEIYSDNDKELKNLIKKACMEKIIEICQGSGNHGAIGKSYSKEIEKIKASDKNDAANTKIVNVQKLVSRYLEECAIEYLQTINAPPTYTIKEINEVYEKLQAKPNGKSKENEEKNKKWKKFAIVHGLDVRKLQECKSQGSDYILQVASQFDFQESKKPVDTPVSQYPQDITQGPLASVVAVVSALHRKAVKNNRNKALKHIAASNKKSRKNINNDQKDALMDVLDDKHYTGSIYKHGYLEPHLLQEDTEREKLHTSITQNNNTQNIRMLAQWSICEQSKTMQLQVFCAAPSYQGRDVPPITSVDGKICKELVVAQYEAIAKLAVIRSKVIGKEVKLHLTLVGQGVFKNPNEIMGHVVNKVQAIVNDAQVKVFLHAYNDADNAILEQHCEEMYHNSQHIDHEEFKQEGANINDRQDNGSNKQKNWYTFTQKEIHQLYAAYISTELSSSEFKKQDERVREKKYEALFGEQLYMANELSNVCSKILDSSGKFSRQPKSIPFKTNSLKLSLTEDQKKYIDNYREKQKAKQKLVTINLADTNILYEIYNDKIEKELVSKDFLKYQNDKKQKNKTGKWCIRLMINDILKENKIATGVFYPLFNGRDGYTVFLTDEQKNAVESAIKLCKEQKNLEKVNRTLGITLKDNMDQLSLLLHNKSSVDGIEQAAVMEEIQKVKEEIVNNAEEYYSEQLQIIDSKNDSPALALRKKIEQQAIVLDAIKRAQKQV